MAGMIDILGSLLQQGMTQSGNARVSNTIESQNNDGSNGGSLGDIIGGLGSLLGGNTAGSANTNASADGLSGMLGGMLAKLADNGAAAGGIGALIGSVLGGGADSAKGAVGGGALAVLASLALNALKNAGQAQEQNVQTLQTQSEEVLNENAKIIVLAMINAAKADGNIDEDEIEKILGKLGTDGLDASEKAFMEEQLRAPLDTDSIIRLAQNEPTMPAQIYAASLLAIEVDTDAEQEYMDKLAENLGLDAQVVAYIKSSMGIQA